MAKKQSLGKGLDLIFDDNAIESGQGISFISVTSITPKKNQPRKFFNSEALSELASSIAAHGVLQPILVRDIKNGTYEIIAGERRWRASKLAGLSEIPCIIMEADEIEAAQVALIENVQREDLNAYEEAKAFKSLVDDFGLSQEEISKKVGKSRPAIANSLRLLDLPENVVDLLIKNDLSAGHCRTLLGLHDKNKIYPLAIKVLKRNLSVRETESAVKKMNAAVLEEEKTENNNVLVNYFEELERKARDLSGRTIKIINGRGKRSVQIEYSNNEDLEYVLSLVCGKEITEE